MTKTLLATALLTLSCISICAAATNKNPCSKKDAKAIETATNTYLDKQPGGITSKDITMLSKQCVGAYAKVKIHPIKPVTDDAIVYLHKVKSQWQVMTLGTSFDEDFLKQIPEAIRNYN